MADGDINFESYPKTGLMTNLNITPQFGSVLIELESIDGEGSNYAIEANFSPGQSLRFAWVAFRCAGRAAFTRRPTCEGAQR